MTILIGLAVFAVVVGQSLAAGPSYVASTSALFAVSGGNSATDLNQAATYLQREMTSYVRVATSPRVLQPVIDELGLPDTPATLADDIAVANPTMTVLLDISVTRGNAQEAADIANSLATHLATTVEEMAPSQTQGELTRKTVEVTTLNEATPPTAPTGLGLATTAALGLIAGFIAAFAAALLISGIDGRIRNVDDIRRLRGSTLLAALPSTKETGPARTGRLALHLERAAGLLAGKRPGPEGAVVMVTAPSPDPDIETVAQALATATTGIGGRAAIVNLIDASPMTVVALAQGASPIGPFDTERSPSGQLDVAVTTNATGATVTEKRPADLRALAAEFDLVILQTAAYAASADSQLLSSAVDAAAIVVTMGVPKERVSSTQAGLRALEAENVVIIANRVAKRDL